MVNASLNSQPQSHSFRRDRAGVQAALQVQQLSAASKLIRRSQDIIELSWSNIHIEKTIGIGHFSRVYSVQISHPDMKYKRFAIKCLNKGTMSDAALFYKAAADLASEAEILARLKHENVVQVHGTSAGGPLYAYTKSDRGDFVVLDLLQEETLQDKLTLYRNKIKKGGFKKTASLSGLVESMKDVALGIAKGMSYLHSQNVILRDLKPANIGFDYDGTVKLFDFGFAREAHTIDPLECCGTIRYMAPEIMRHKGASLASDVYSFGILLWELCTLEKPFKGIADPEVFKDQVFLGNSRPSLISIKPTKLKFLLRMCWDGSPENRCSIDTVLRFLQKQPAESIMAFAQREFDLTSESLPMMSWISPHKISSDIKKNDQDETKRFLHLKPLSLRIKRAQSDKTSFRSSNGRQVEPKELNTSNSAKNNDGPSFAFPKPSISKKLIRAVSLTKVDVKSPPPLSPRVPWRRRSSLRSQESLLIAKEEHENKDATNKTAPSSLDNTTSSYTNQTFSSTIATYSEHVSFL